MTSLYENYCSGGNKVAQLLTIYIEEAHPMDEWRLPESEVEVKDGVALRTHQVMDDRLAAAKLFVKNRYGV